jgi:hypothetical protein
LEKDSSGNMQHHLKNVVFHCLNISCKDPIEKEYYNPDNGKQKNFATPIICAWCTSIKGFLEQKELQNQNLTGGYQCLLICK